MFMFVLRQLSHFLRKIHSNTFQYSITVEMTYLEVLPYKKQKNKKGYDIFLLNMFNGFYNFSYGMFGNLEFIFKC